MKTSTITQSIAFFSFLVIISMSVWLEGAKAQSPGIFRISDGLKNQNYYGLHLTNEEWTTNVPATGAKDSIQNSRIGYQKQKAKLVQSYTNGEEQNGPGNERGSREYFSLKDKIFFILSSNY